MSGVKLLRLVEPWSGTRETICLSVCYATMVYVYSRRADAMLPRLSISQQDDEIIVEPCIAKNQVARIDRFLLKAGEVSGRFGLPANGQWTFEGIIEATDEEITALQGEGYQLTDLRTKSLSNLLEEFSGDDLRHKSRPRQIVLFDEVFVEKEWAGPLANERRERAKADDQASVLMRALANERRERAKADDQASVLMRALANERRERAKADDQVAVLSRALAEERVNTDEQVRALAEERADVKRLNSVLSNERDARRRGWFCWTLTVIITVITIVFLYIR
jgi:hypothetical protein